jgi:ABC-type antimicrobial peptide transport system permease subunit
MSNQKLSMVLLSLFAGTALVLAAIGLYGVVAYSVAQRTNEIGIRMALGAQAGDVFKMVLGHGLNLALIGLAVGVAAALALSRLITSLLYGVSSYDLRTFVVSSLLLVAVAVLASFLPARRATRVQPNIALRAE